MDWMTSSAVGDGRSPLRIRIAVLGLLLGIWTIPGLLCAVQIYAEEVVRDGHAYATASILWYALPVWWVWLPLTLGVAVLSRRFPITENRRLSSLVIHAIGCVAAVTVHLFAYAAWIGVAAPYAEVDTNGVFARFVGLLDDAWVHVDFFIYWLIVGSVHAFDYYRESRRRELRESRLKAQLKDAQLDALRAQLRPHFLFNALSAIQTLTLRNGDRQSAQMIARLSEFLRTTLDGKEKNLIPLADELSFVDQYVAIEKCRFEGRLTVETDIDPEVKGTPVPTLILQPIVENAIRHGIEPKDGPGRITIEAWREEDRLGLRVIDDGVGTRCDGPQTIGQGLSNTEKRLTQLYGNNFSLDITSSPEEGFTVTLLLPSKITISTDEKIKGDQVPSPEVSLS